MSTTSEYQKYLFPFDHPRLQMARGMDALQFGKLVRTVPMPAAMIENWEKLQQEPFHGITCDGHIESGLYKLADEGAPTRAMVAATHALLDQLDESDRRR